MSIISQETWDNIPEEEKRKILADYTEFNKLSKNGIDEEERIINTNLKWQMEKYFGKENLQPKQQIRTWEDVKKYYKSAGSTDDYYIHFAYGMASGVSEKCIATLKIAKLIELGYGGMLTKEEWKKSSSCEMKDAIWSIVCNVKDEPLGTEIKIIPVWAQLRLLSFRTKEQAEEFMSYPENVELVKQYNLL